MTVVPVERRRRPRGRPPKPESERISEILHLRVTVAEADAIHTAAIHRGVSVSCYLRLLLRDVLPTPPNGLG